MKLKYQSLSRGHLFRFVCVSVIGILGILKLWAKKYKTPSICVEFIYCVINSDYSLKATLSVFCGRNFYGRLTVQSSMSSNYSYVVSISLKFCEVVVKYFLYKRIFGFPPFWLYYLFMRLFLIQSKSKNSVKDINQNFTSNKLNEKNFEDLFVKNLICEYLTS